MFKILGGFLTLLVAAAAAFGAPFENDIEKMSVDTPQGKFECVNGKATGYRQVLRLGGHVMFEEKPGPTEIEEDSTLLHGIEQRNTGCPWVVAVSRGFVVIRRDLQPPSYGVQNYAVIDFNKAAPSLTILASGQRPEDDGIPESQRIEWSANSLTLRVVGYASDVECCSISSPKPKPVRTQYTYRTGRVEVVK